MQTPILSTISDRCAKRISRQEAIERLRLLDAQQWLIDSLEEIEIEAEELADEHNDRFRPGYGAYVLPSAEETI